MNVFFHYFSTSDDFFPLAGEKRASVPYLLHRIARVSTTLHHHHHHPSPPPFCAGTPLFLFFLSSVRRSAELRSEESGVRLSSDRVPFFCAHVFTRSHAVAFPHVSQEDWINHTCIVSFVRGERAKSKRAHRAATRAHNVYPSLCHDSERDRDTEARGPTQKERTLNPVFSFILSLK